jgi:ABC-type sugar transport system ATPase subunit
MENISESVVQMRDVPKRFGEVNAVDMVSMDVPPRFHLWFHRIQRLW